MVDFGPIREQIEALSDRTRQSRATARADTYRRDRAILAADRAGIPGVLIAAWADITPTMVCKVVAQQSAREWRERNER